MEPNSLLYTNKHEFNRKFGQGGNSLLYLSHNNVTFLPTSLYTLGLPLFLCSIPFQFYVFKNLSCFHHAAHKIPGHGTKFCDASFFIIY